MIGDQVYEWYLLSANKHAYTALRRFEIKTQDFMNV